MAVLAQAFFLGENDRSGYVEVTQNLFHANDRRSEFSHARSRRRNSTADR